MLALLDGHDPRVIGTPPLGLAMPDSDIDIACTAADPAALAGRLWPLLADHADVSFHQWRQDGRPLIVNLVAGGWPIEIFAAPMPVEAQAGWIHFEVERRLLALGGARFREAVLALRRAGAKTEPAFAAVLALPGDPYPALIGLAARPDAALADLLATRGFVTDRRW